MAMGRLVVPQDRLSIALGNPSKVDPRPTPSAMARKIHKVRYRSRNDRRSRLGCAVILIPRSTGDTPAGGIDHLDRKSVVQGKSVSVRVDLGGRRIIKKK